MAAAAIPSFEDFKAQLTKDQQAGLAPPAKPVPTFEEFKNGSATKALAPKTTSTIEAMMDADTGKTGITPNGRLIPASPAGSPIAQGVEQMASPSAENKMGGASKIIRGAGEAVAPIGLGMGLGAPAAGVGGLLGGTGAGTAARMILPRLGASEEGTNLGGDIASIAGGTAGGSVGSAVDRLTTPGALRRIVTSPDVQKSAFQLPIVGKVLKFGNSVMDALRGDSEPELNPIEKKQMSLLTTPKPPKFSMTQRFNPDAPPPTPFKPAPTAEQLRYPIKPDSPSFQPAPTADQLKYPAKPQEKPFQPAPTAGQLNYPPKPTEPENKWANFKPAPTIPSLGSSNRFAPKEDIGSSLERPSPTGTPNETGEPGLIRPTHQSVLRHDQATIDKARNFADFIGEKYPNSNPDVIERGLTVDEANQLQKEALDWSRAHGRPVPQTTYRPWRNMAEAQDTLRETAKNFRNLKQ